MTYSLVSSQPPHRAMQSALHDSMKFARASFKTLSSRSRTTLAGSASSFKTALSSRPLGQFFARFPMISLTNAPPSSEGMGTRNPRNGNSPRSDASVSAQAGRETLNTPPDDAL